MKKTLELLYEVGTLRNLKRTWSQFLGQEVANVAEHSLRVIWLALAISRLEKKGNEEKIIKIALLHDLCESRTGDKNYVHSLYTQTDDKRAVADSLKDTIFSQDFNSLYQEYKERSTIEGQIVKDADMLDVDMELAELEEKGLIYRKDWLPYRDIMSKRLFTNAAKKIYKEIQQQKPNHWHVKLKEIVKK